MATIKLKVWIDNRSIERCLIDNENFNMQIPEVGSEVMVFDYNQWRKCRVVELKYSWGEVAYGFVTLDTGHFLNLREGKKWQSCLD